MSLKCMPNLTRLMEMGSKEDGNKRVGPRLEQDQRCDGPRQDGPEQGEPC